MIEILAANITSPLGGTVEENYRAVKSGASTLKCYDNWRGVPAKFTASMFSSEQVAELSLEGFTRFESLVIRSIEEALQHHPIDTSSPGTILILSTTKANVDELDIDGGGEYLSPGATAKKVAAYFAMVSEPIVVCNACISGVTAQVLADRLLSSGEYDTAIVCGADTISPFVLSGFLSFKSLSPEECRPFDIERLGLNLGEAASTIIFGRAQEPRDGGVARWRLLDSCLTNDAYHLSAPSPVGEGVVEAITKVMNGVRVEDIGVVCVHGTATMFNDQMESKAIEATALSNTPLSAFKGYYGHTLGAAGLLETVLTIRALEDGAILPVRGFGEIGVGGKIDISAEERRCNKSKFLKIISGFGGCNGALLYDRGGDCVAEAAESVEYEVERSVRITPNSVEADGKIIPTTATGGALLKELYKEYIGDYAKFYKMDTMSRLALVATELLLREESTTEWRKEGAIVLFNSTSSIVADLNHFATIRERENFYPSPSLFLYTLPNIAVGEVAIRHAVRGETSLYILAQRDERVMDRVIAATLRMGDVERLITGWIDCSGEDIFETEIKIVTKKR